MHTVAPNGHFIIERDKYGSAMVKIIKYGASNNSSDWQIVEEYETASKGAAASAVKACSKHGIFFPPRR